MVEAIVIVAALLVVLAVPSLVVGRPRATPPPEQAGAEIESVDIDQMIEARNERRRRAGREEIGGELAREALRRPPDR